MTGIALFLLAGLTAAEPAAPPDPQPSAASAVSADIVSIPGVSADVLSQAAEEEDLTVVSLARHGKEQPVLKVTSLGCTISLVTDVKENQVTAFAIAFGNGKPHLKASGAAILLDFEDKQHSFKLYSERYRRKILTYLGDFQKGCGNPPVIF